MAISRRLALGGALSAWAARPGWAAGFPTPGKPIVIIVPYAPGGSTDTSARMVGAGLQQALKVPVQVINRPGAGSQIGAAEMVRAAPDGHTLLWAVLPTLITHYMDPSRKPPYHRADFQPVGLHHFSPVVVAVRSNSPYRSLRDLLEAARANPEGVSISDSGLMATPNMGVLMLQQVAGVRFANVHYTSGPESATALIGGHVDAVAGGAADVSAQWKAGEFRVLGTAWHEPDPLLPGVPTMREQGYDVIIASASGLMAPAGTPPEVVVRISAIMQQTMADPAYIEKMVAFGITPSYAGPEFYADYWARDEQRMAPIIRAVSDK